jgi:hypothetical protein
LAVAVVASLLSTHFKVITFGVVKSWCLALIDFFMTPSLWLILLVYCILELHSFEEGDMVTNKVCVTSNKDWYVWCERKRGKEKTNKGERH